MKMKKMSLFFLAFIAIIGFATTSAKAASMLIPSQKEGKVTIYGQVGPELRVALTKAIKEELGLDLQLVPGKGSEVATRYLTEMQAGTPSADIILGGASTFVSRPELYNSWQALEPHLILPEVLDAKSWPNGKLPFLDRQKKLIPLILQANQFLLVNTDSVKPGEIKAYRDLLQPKWKGKIVMYDPTIGGTAQTWVQLILTKAYGMEKGEAFLRKFAAQEPMITRDSRLQSEWLARGRYPVTIGLDSQAAYRMQKSGGPITRLAAEEGCFLSGGGGYLVMPKKQPHPQAAAAVLNWLLSAQGQRIYSKGYGAPATRLGVETEGLSPLAYPLAGEKVYLQDEDVLSVANKTLAIAKQIFGPLKK